MTLFTEYPEKDEQVYSKRVQEATRTRMDKLYGQTEKALRDTHAKTQVCVKGTLEIFDFDEAAVQQAVAKLAGLSAEQQTAIKLKQGLFAQPRQYPVWIRFANGRTTVESDYVDDTRSISVKIMDVDGERLPVSHEAHTQDLILQNGDIFFIRSIRDYYSFFRAISSSTLRVILWLIFHPKQKAALKGITSHAPKSLLTERYWSGSASALGLPANFDPTQPGHVPVTYPTVVKYALTPVSSHPPHAPLPREARSEAERKSAKTQHKKAGVPDNYYREELIQALAKPEATYCWHLQIQVQTNPEMSIDDVTVSWDEAKAPFFTIGRLTVSHQSINFESQCDFCENLRFSPWNGLAVHRPVGALNRLRSSVYEIVGKYRHQKQNLDYQEPTGIETFN
ncbi:MAG: catalase [Leptolyngbya sp. SIO1D8]|nr:catalase [Leptolyngbya sp. SIO1D8]